jgi:hypothetical protein
MSMPITTPPQALRVSPVADGSLTVEFDGEPTDAYIEGLTVAVQRDLGHSVEVRRELPTVVRISAPLALNMDEDLSLWASAYFGV